MANIHVCNQAWNRVGTELVDRKELAKICDVLVVVVVALLVGCFCDLQPGASDSLYVQEW